ncbi:MAG TPA: primosomal protein N' [Desulfobacteraceae bacterium]|nr:primosomal protein N' [Desulfobacteraceae bacterium]
MYEVAVVAPIRKTLTYAQPDGREGEPGILPGQRVLVPLGRRLVTGYVLAAVDATEAGAAGHKIKPIAELLDPAPLYPPGLIPFFRWIADYYHHPLGEVIRTALPGGLNAGSGRTIFLTEQGGKELRGGAGALSGGDGQWLERLLTAGELAPGAVARLWRETALRNTLLQWQDQGWIQIEAQVIHKGIKEKKQTRVKIDSALSAEMEKAAGGNVHDPSAAIDVVLPELGKAQKKTLSLLFELCRDAGALSVARAEVTRRYSGAGKALRELAGKDIVRVEECRVYRDPFDSRPLFFPRPDRLTGEQETVLEELSGAMDRDVFQPFLLHGVTGCGKTEVYLRATEKVLDRGKSVLVLAPEIALASQLEGHFYCRFGDRLALLHSRLSAGEHHDQWQRIASGRARVVIGARSAVFAPLDNLGLVIVDEEHEPAYKQDDGLRYNGRDLAVLRARFAGCPVILGSATPSVVSYQHALSGKYRLLTMRRRILDRLLPEVRIVDLAAGRSTRPDLFFSDELMRALWDNMEKRQQSLLFVNRRGFASFMMCRDCGHIVQCRHCQVSLTMHRQIGRLVCHYCGYSLTTKIVCPSCGSTRMEGSGLGSERIEQEVRQLLPHARVARLDSDTVSSRRKYIEILRAVHQQDVDVLVGTQMIAKGLHFPHMTLVGVVWADSGLGMPDFRASERTFQLLAQVTGRAGRGDQPGKVIIQTYQPDHYAVRCAQQHDYRGFYDRELEMRRERRYPPFSRMVNIRFSAAGEAKVKECAEKAGDFLRKLAGSDVEVMGPAPAPLVRIKDKTRWQIMLKSSRLNRLHELSEALAAHSCRLCPGNITLALDVDPENMM